MKQAPFEGGFHETLFDVPPEHIVQSSRGKGWPGLDIAEVIHPLDDFALPAIPCHVLVLNLGPPSHIQEHLVGRQGNLETGNFVLLAAGAPSHWHLERQGEVRHLHLYLTPLLIQKIANAANIYSDRIEFMDVLGTTDVHLEALVLSLFRELRTDGLGGRLYVESVGNLLGLHLLRQYSSVKPSLPSRSVGLTSSLLTRVITYIEEHLAEELSLSELATVVHLSPYYFARLFKESTGLPPHRYVIHRRIERAKALLSTTNWPFALIAQTVGFAHESHLALHFKRLTGLTPRDYR